MAGYSPHVGENLVAQEGLSTFTLGISVLSFLLLLGFTCTVLWVVLHHRRVLFLLQRRRREEKEMLVIILGQTE